MRTVSDLERRSRLARRHHVAPQHRAPDVVTAARDVVALHSTDPSTVFLSCRARVNDVEVADVRRSLENDRTLVKDLAMRRTVFALPADALWPVQAAVGDRIARAERNGLERDVERHGLHRDGQRWLENAMAQVLALLADGRPRNSAELRAELPTLAGSYPQGAGTTWAGTVAIGPRVLTVLSARGLLVRGPSEGHWRMPRHRWVRTEEWTGSESETWTERDGAVWLVGHWLRAFGPGTERDLKWWTGTTLGLVRDALADLDAVEVALSDGTGWLLPDDLDPEPDVTPWAALLPPLDPTTMGWQQRDWYLSEQRTADLIDSAGNAGPTAWWDGRVVGGWRQDDHGVVELQGLEDIGHEARTALEQEAERVTEWCDGVRVILTHPTPLARRLASR
ncbi:winged helix DNA-binding domain-containing protein [Arthrobacter tecti]